MTISGNIYSLKRFIGLDITLLQRLDNICGTVPFLPILKLPSMTKSPLVITLSCGSRERNQMNDRGRSTLQKLKMATPVPTENEVMTLKRVYFFYIICDICGLSFIQTKISMPTYSCFFIYQKQLSCWWSFRKHAYSNTLKILSPKNENFQIKNSDIFHIPHKT